LIMLNIGTAINSFGTPISAYCIDAIAGTPIT
jgi:hypothetical protein